MALSYRFNLLFDELLEHNGRVHGDAPAVVDGGRRLTWSQLDRETCRFANALHRAGHGKGDKVALLMLNSLETFTAFWGAIRAGCVVVPLNVLLDEASLARLLDDSDARVIFVDDDTRPQLDAVRDRLRVIDADGCFSFGEPATGYRSAQQLIADAPDTPPRVTIAPEDSMMIMYTSGTTGTPKGIEHSHLSRMMYPLGFGLSLGCDRWSVALLGTPIYASGTWMTMLPTMYRGGATVLTRGWSSASFLAALERERATHSFLVPAQFIALLDDPGLADRDTSSLRCLITAGQPIAPATYAALRAHFPQTGIYEVYGMTEGFATIRTPADAEHGKRDTVGKPLLLDDVRIVGADDAELGRGETGEIVAYGIGMMKGYYKNPELTERASWTSPAGRTYMRSGDLGQLDEDGYLHVAGRLKDMIKSGGMNVFAVDIEAVFMEHPDISEAAVIGVPHERWGETPLLVALARAGASVDAEALRAWGNERLAKYQRVSAVVLSDELPRATYGKVSKQQLRELHRAGALDPRVSA